MLKGGLDLVSQKQGSERGDLYISWEWDEGEGKETNISYLSVLDLPGYGGFFFLLSCFSSERYLFACGLQ